MLFTFTPFRGLAINSLAMGSFGELCVFRSSFRLMLLRILDGLRNEDSFASALLDEEMLCNFLNM